MSDDSCCMNCVHLELLIGSLGYCSIEDHNVSINYVCDAWDIDEEEDLD